MRRFHDRREAGQELASRLEAYRQHPHTIVLGLPRGGVPVAHEVAGRLGLPLDVLVVRKLGTPGHEELAMGAIAAGGGRALNTDLIAGLHVGATALERVEAAERAELERRERAYRDQKPFPVLRDQTVILVDDGLATGATMRAAIDAVKRQSPARVVVAVPTAPPDVCAALEREVDEVISVIQPEPFVAVGLWYGHFPQVSDEEVRAALKNAQPSSDTPE
jgi:putative phosphoribosyl transferase